ncbi:MAG: FRG domain-containing protein [Planctomycetota bacterium]|jgi:hypothetical protein
MDCRIADYNVYKALGGMGDWNSGILNVRLSSWDEFHNVTGQLLDLGDCIWRGQINDWPLISKFDRVIKSNRDDTLRDHREAFIRAIQGRRGNNPPNLDEPEEIWALGQHYGLATPLLDWTESPFVAAYFAFQEKSVRKITNAAICGRILAGEDREAVLKDVPPRFVYGLSKDIIRWGPAEPEGGEPHHHFIRWVESSSHENPRLLNQRGLFTEPLSADIEIEKIVGLCYAEDKDKGLSRIIFVKIEIPEVEREACLRNLNRMNINHATLFPDLTGAAEYCNLKLEIENHS